MVYSDISSHWIMLTSEPFCKRYSPFIGRIPHQIFHLKYTLILCDNTCNIRKINLTCNVNGCVKYPTSKSTNVVHNMHMYDNQAYNNWLLMILIQELCNNNGSSSLLLFATSGYFSVMNWVRIYIKDNSIKYIKSWYLVLQ